jgi:hypothetical protein
LGTEYGEHFAAQSDQWLKERRKRLAQIPRHQKSHLGFDLPKDRMREIVAS